MRFSVQARGLCRTALIVLIILSVNALAQVPPVAERTVADLLADAEQWMEIGAYFIARQDLEEALSEIPETGKRADVLFLLLRASFEDHAYEEAFNWSNTFLLNYPEDTRKNEALLVQGVSAFQTGRLDLALTALNSFLKASADHPDRGAALYWRAMCALEQNDWASAESDLQACYQDSLLRGHHDEALMGLALSLERRGEYALASERIDQLLAEFPRSKFATDARIRLASLSLQLNNPQRALHLLQETKPVYPRQREEYMLLRAEASYRLGDHGDARRQFGDFLSKFPESPFARKVRYELSWSDIRFGLWQAAIDEFNLLRNGSDTLAYAARYQTGVLLLLEGKPDLAMQAFDTVVMRSPYDTFAEQSYFQTGMIQYRDHHYRDARRNFQLAARLFPEDRLRAQSFRMMGEASMALGDFSNAQYAFAQIQHIGAPSELIAAAKFQEGVCLYRLGRFRSSVERFDDFLRGFPRDPHTADAYVWRGEALYQDSRFDDAERSFADALRLFPNHVKRADAAYGLAWTLFEQKKFTQAAAAFERFTHDYQQSEHRLEASLRKADCYFFMGEYDKASVLYASLASEKTESQQAEYAAFQLAMSYIQRGDAERGIVQLREFLTRFPSSIYNEVVQFNIGWILFSMEKYQEALAELRICQSRFPESQLMPRVLFNMGDAFYNLKQYDSARVYYQRVLDEFPQSPLTTDALNGLQFAFEAEGKPTAVLPLIDKYLSARSTDSSAEELVLKKADILFDQGDFGGAVLEYQRGLGLKLSRVVHARALRQLGRAYEMENNPSRAISYYQQVLSDFSDTEVAPTAALSLALLQIKSKQYQAAATTLQDFDRRYPSSPLLAEARYQLGVAKMNVPDRKAAMQQFEAVVQKHPGDIFADRSRLQIARLHQTRKEYRAALDTLDEIVKHRSDDIAAEALLMIGENYLLTKKTADALQAFKDVVDQYTEFSLLVERAKLGSGECYERLGERGNARSVYEEVAKDAVDPAIRKDAQARLKRLSK